MHGKKSAVYGEVQRTDGIGAPARIIDSPIGTIDKAGYPPERIDPLIKTLINNAEMGSGLLLKYTPILKQLLDKMATELQAVLTNLSPPDPKGEPVAGVPDNFTQVVNLAENVSRILERVNKMMSLSVKAKDEATRLRTFLATGDVDDGGLAALGENQLKEIVRRAAEGWQKAESDA